MKAIYLLVIPSILLGQEVRAPQRGEERREPNRVERPEPVRVQPQPPQDRQRPVEPVRPMEPQRPQQLPPPVMGNRPPIGYMDPFFGPMGRNQCWRTMGTRWDCRDGITVEFQTVRRPRMNRRRPNRIEMAPLTEKQQKQLLALRKEFIQKRNRILNNP